MKFQDYCRGIGATFAVLGVILLFLGVAGFSENLYAGTVYSLIGIFQIIIAGLFLALMREKTGSELGNLAVTCCWWILSIGIAGAALFPSQFLRVSLTYAIVSTVIAVIWIVLGAFSIRLAISRTGASLVV